MKVAHFMRTIGISLLLLAVMGGAGLPAWAEKNPYKVGVNLSLTGPLSNFSLYIKNALILEQDRVNAQGGIDGHPLELIFEDNNLDITKMANIHRKFARDKEIKAIIGPLWNTATPTLTPIVEREKIPDMVICPTSPIEREWKPKWAFYIAQGDPVVAAKVMDLVMARGYKRVFAFNDQDPNLAQISVNMKEMGLKHGIEVFITKENYHTTDTDMTPQILKFKDQLKDYDALFLGTNGGTGSIVMRNLLAQDIHIPVMGTHAFGFGFTLAVGKEAVEGIEFPSGKAVVTHQLDDSDPQKAVIVDFDKRMKERWDMPAEQLSGHSYDIIWILYHAFKRAGENPTRAQLRDAIEQTKNFVGVTGIYNYSPTDHEGLTKNSLAFIRIENNSFVRIKLPEYE
jgi:branched-chain amino acid transport system substrate-binding protein